MERYSYSSSISCQILFIVRKYMNFVLFSCSLHCAISLFVISEFLYLSCLSFAEPYKYAQLLLLFFVKYISKVFSSSGTSIIQTLDLLNIILLITESHFCLFSGFLSVVWIHNFYQFDFSTHVFSFISIFLLHLLSSFLSSIASMQFFFISYISIF